MHKQWYEKSAADVVAELHSSLGGLSELDAKELLLRFGSNSLPQKKVDSIFVIFLRQFQSSLIYILLGAAVIVYFIEGATDAAIIMAVLVFNALIGAFQEGRAQNTLKALKDLTKTNCVVIRGGSEIIIDDRLLVKGDIIKLREGDRVPADARIISTNNLKVDEASLTGESEPVLKVEEAISKKKLIIGDQKNMVFRGTNVLVGSATAVVVSTGINTEIGKIAKTLAEDDTEMPLKKNIKLLSKLIIIIVAILSSFLFALGLYKEIELREMFSVVVSLAVSVIPEGLPIVITLILATSVSRMAKKNVLVKKLQAVEALGQAKVIAVDKTGTITKNELVVKEVFTSENYFIIGGTGYEPKGEIFVKDKTIEPNNHPDLMLIGKIGSLASEGRATLDSKEKKWKISGDPTEVAITVLSSKLNLHKDLLVKEMPVIKEFPFDYRYKIRGSLNRDKNGNLLTLIGAPEAILARSKYYFENGKKKKLTTEVLAKFEERTEQMSKNALRIIAIAYEKTKTNKDSIDSVDNLILVGLLGLKDSLREEVPNAMRRAKDAGVKVIMITGDHKLTAEAIARDAHLLEKGDRVMTGVEIDKLSDTELAHQISSVGVYARVTPEHKMRIINAFKNQGITIAMTGDGVNDAPSLVAADLGVSMGKIGTEVAKEAGDLVLLDDNFGNIVAAIEEGRSIYKNIKKVILYLFSTSAGEAITIIGALLIDLPLPILAAQIIWLNFVTDAFLVAAPAMEPIEKNLRDDLYRKPGKYLVDYNMATRMLTMSIVMAVGTLILFGIYHEDNLVKAWTISLSVLAVYQWFNAWNCRSETDSVFETRIGDNKFLVGATIIVIMLQLLAVYNPFMQKVLNTTALSFFEWIIVIVFASTIIISEEIRKKINKTSHIKTKKLLALQ